MRLRDLGLSICVDVGSDSADSLYEHTATIGRIALHEFMRAGRGIPKGYVEEAAIRFVPRMLDIQQGKEKPIVIVPIGDVQVQVIDMIVRLAWDVFGVPVRVLRRRTLWPDAYDPKSKKAEAGKMLHLGAVTGLMKHGRVIMVTDHELYAAEKNNAWVYGYGSMMAPICVVSTYGIGNFNRDSRLPWSRMVKLVIHEIGHTLGLVHHVGDPCVMSIGPGMDDRLGIDIMPHDFCSRCLGDVLAGRSQFKESQKKEEPPCSVEYSTPSSSPSGSSSSY